MRFSIRTLLAFTFLVALALLAWRTFKDAQRDGARAALLQNEIKVLSNKVRLDKPELHAAMLTAQDEYDSLHVMRERSLAHFDELREKYSSIEPRGADVISIRGLPAMSLDGEPAPAVFRMLIPEERPTWIKFGVHKAKHRVNSSRSSESEDDLLSESPFGASGPFERRLSTGVHTLDVFTGRAKDGAVPIEISLDDGILVRTSFVSADVSGNGTGHISAPSQIDFGPRRNPPWLYSATMNYHRPTSAAERSDTHAFSLWLSDRSSKFQEFPGE